MTTHSILQSTAPISDLNGRIENPPAWLVQALETPRSSHTVHRDGCDLHYFEWGQRDKPSIILLHGFLAHARCFAFIAPFLCDDYHVVAMDMAGMGDSGWRENYTMEDRVADFICVAEDAGLFDSEQKPTIIAHSFGGMVATQAMPEHGERFKGLVICDLMIIRPSYLMANKEKFGPPGKRDPNRQNRVYPDYELAKSRFVLSPPQQTGVPALFDFMAFHSLREVDGGWQWKFDARVLKVPANIEDHWAKTGEYVLNAPIPTAIVHGEDSMLFPPDSVHYMNELADERGVARLPIIAIPHAKHHLMLDQPVAFASVLRALLAVWA